MENCLLPDIDLNSKKSNYMIVPIEELNLDDNVGTINYD